MKSDKKKPVCKAVATPPQDRAIKASEVENRELGNSDYRPRQMRMPKAHRVLAFLFFCLGVAALHPPRCVADTYTVWGRTIDLGGSSLETKLTWTPTNLTMISSGGLQVGAARTITSTNGWFTNVWDCGDYWVKPALTGRAAFLVAVPCGGGTNNITNLIVNATSYVYTNAWGGGGDSDASTKAETNTPSLWSPTVYGLLSGPQLKVNIGYNNQILGDNGFVQGSANILGTAAAVGPVIGGTENYANGDRAFILGASQATNLSDYASGIVGGRYGYIGGVEVAGLFHGIHNRWEGGDDGVILGGYALTNADGEFGWMLGGKGSLNAGTEGTGLDGGATNKILGASRWSSIADGWFNVIDKSTNSHIANSSGSRITNGYNSYIIGSTNCIVTAANASIIGGMNLSNGTPNTTMFGNSVVDAGDHFTYGQFHTTNGLRLGTVDGGVKSVVKSGGNSAVLTFDEDEFIWAFDGQLVADGSGLTGLNASSLASGTVPVGRLGSIDTVAELASLLTDETTYGAAALQANGLVQTNGNVNAFVIFTNNGVSISYSSTGVFTWTNYGAASQGMSWNTNGILTFGSTTTGAVFRATSYDFTTGNGWSFNSSVGGPSTAAAGITGNFSVVGGLFFPATAFATFDTAMRRKAAGLVSIDNGTANNYRDLVARDLYATNTVTATNGFISPSQNISLTADNQVIGATNSATLFVSSDNVTAGNRTFLLTTGIDGKRLTLVWSGTNAGELVDDSANSGSGNIRLNGTWTPAQYDVLNLVGVGTDWYETGRSDN